MILNIKLNLSGITLSVKIGDKNYLEKVKDADEILKGLDRILKKSKINFARIRDVRIVNNSEKNTGYTSQRIAKAIQKALNFSLKFNKI